MMALIFDGIPCIQPIEDKYFGRMLGIVSTSSSKVSTYKHHSQRITLNRRKAASVCLNGGVWFCPFLSSLKQRTKLAFFHKLGLSFFV